MKHAYMTGTNESWTNPYKECPVFLAPALPSTPQPPNIKNRKKDCGQINRELIAHQLAAFTLDCAINTAILGTRRKFSLVKS